MHARGKRNNKMCLLHDVNALITYFTSISYLSIKDLARTIIKSLTNLFMAI